MVDNDRSEGVTGRGMSDARPVGGDTVGMETSSRAGEVRVWRRFLCYICFWDI